MNECRLAVFDMAGTTVRDTGQVAGALTEALVMHGLALTPEQLRDVRGASKRQAVWHLVPDGPDRARRVDEVYASFRRHLANRYRNEGVAPIEGVEATFRWLRSIGVQVALNTGFDREITDLLLDALRWNTETLDAVVCGDEVARGRPDPYLIFHAMEATGTSSVHSVANVGDTALDLEAGHRAGVRWNIGVLSGAHDRERLERAPHTHIIPSVASLRGFWTTV